MIKYIVIILLGLSACSEMSSEEKDGSEVKDGTENGFDQKLAEDVGADSYGMKQYVLAILKTGPTKPESEEEANRLQTAHMQNIKRLAEEGHLVLAGPFMDSGDWRGIYLFDVKTIEEAEALTQSDPAIQAGIFVTEFYSWYGSAALLKIPELHEKITKEKF